MAVLGRTRAVFSKMLTDIKTITFWTNIIVQSVFFIFYGYSIYANINRIPFLVIYALLFIIATTTFITYLLTHNKNGKKPKRFNRSVKIIKFVANGTMIVLNVCEMLKYTATDLNKIILAVSAISLFAQIVIELLKVFIERYVDLFSKSLEMDLEIINKLGKVKEVKGTFFEILDAPLEAIANKLEHKEPELTKQEQYLNQLSEEYSEELKEKKILKKEQKKAETKRRSDENAKKQKQEMKEHWNTIKNNLFKKKPKE